MKTLLAVLITALGLSAASSELLKVNLPGPVMVNGVQLPTGECSVQEMSNGSDNIVLLLRSDAGPQATIMANRISDSRDKKSGVVLTLHDSQYTLEEVWLNPAEGFRILRTNGQ